VSELESVVPNLVSLGVVSCNYSIDRRSSSGRIPSPSDVTLELLGQASLSDDAANKLREENDWQPIERDQVPEALRTILPAGQILRSFRNYRGHKSNPPQKK
jgi:hypothetical protein